MMNNESNVVNVVISFCLIVILIGGANWLTTGIKNIQDDTETNDLLDLIGLPQDANNWIYIVVGVVTILISLALLAEKVKKIFSKKQLVTAFGF